jgi:hypothetical protein
VNSSGIALFEAWKVEYQLYNLYNSTVSIKFRGKATIIIKFTCIGVDIYAQINILVEGLDNLCTVLHILINI